MTDTIETAEVEDYLRGLQQRIVSTIEEIDGRETFLRDSWNRPGGGGGESRVLSGGVNLMLAPDSTIAISKGGAMAPDGRSKAFDARANGYVRGEGGGVFQCA